MTWFHGLISRAEAEEYLATSPLGTFLIRISERFNGYALSFRYGERVRHYKLCISRNVCSPSIVMFCLFARAPPPCFGWCNCLQGGYQIEGLQEDFGTIEELVEYYRAVPISSEGGIVLYALDSLGINGCRWGQAYGAAGL